jgi:hypothetical protein
MFYSENWQIYRTQEQARSLRPEMDALSYIFVSGYASTSEQDVTEVASFFINKNLEV